MLWMSWDDYWVKQQCSAESAFQLGKNITSLVLCIVVALWGKTGLISLTGLELGDSSSWYFYKGSICLTRSSLLTCKAVVELKLLVISVSDSYDALLSFAVKYNPGVTCCLAARFLWPKKKKTPKILSQLRVSLRSNETLFLMFYISHRFTALWIEVYSSVYIPVLHTSRF